MYHSKRAPGAQQERAARAKKNAALFMGRR